MRFINLALRTELLVTHNQVRSVDSYRPQSEVFKELALTFSDNGGNAIQGARYYITDTDNGNRASTLASWRSGDSVDYRGGQIYTAVSNASGVTPTRSILTRLIREGLSRQGVYENPATGWIGSTSSIIDYRSRNNGVDDVFDIFIWSYGHLPATITQSLIGDGVLNIDWTLFDDVNITETEAVARAYTGIAIDHVNRIISVTENHTLDEIYDFIVANKLDNLASPSPSTLALRVEGTTLRTDYAFSVVGANVNTGTKFDTLITTGTLIITDVAGDRTANLMNGSERTVRFNIPVEIPPTFIRLHRTNADNTVTIIQGVDYTNSLSVVKILNRPIRLAIHPERYRTEIVPLNNDDTSVIDVNLVPVTIGISPDEARPVSYTHLTLPTTPYV